MPPPVQPQPLFLTVLLLLVPFASADPASAQEAKKPNLIVIMADDLGYADLGCYGGTKWKTPRLDALAKEGLRFTDYHSNGAVCSPTRAALMTGRYQQRCGINGVVFAAPGKGIRENHGLPVDEITFAKRLQSAGYRTAIIGKWHLGYAKKFNPTQFGFDHFRGFLSGNVDFHSHIDGAGFLDWWNNQEIKDEPGYTTHLITRHAVQFIEQESDAPFCLYVAHEAPHYPYQGPEDPAVRKVGVVEKERYPAGRIPRAYGEMVREMDAGVGQIVDALRRKGIERDTFVFFCSDNGGTPHGDNTPLRGHKGTLWEGGHRVPAVAWRPGSISPGESSALTASIDLHPTLLDLAGVSPGAKPLDGVSLKTHLSDRSPLPDRLLYWSHSNRLAVRQGPWKLLASQLPKTPAADPATVELYNLSADLGETRNLASAEPDRAAALHKSLDQWFSSVSKP